MSKVRSDQYVDRAGLASPLFPQGVRVTGVATAGSFTGKYVYVDDLSLVDLFSYKSKNLILAIFGHFGIDLSGKDFLGITLIGTDLAGPIYLSSGNLSGKDLSDTSLIGADLSGANLANVDLSGKDLSGVNFSNANITNVNFDSSILENSLFNNTKMNCVNHIICE